MIFTYCGSVLVIGHIPLLFFFYIFVISKLVVIFKYFNNLGNVLDKLLQKCYDDKGEKYLQNINVFQTLVHSFSNWELKFLFLRARSISQITVSFSKTSYIWLRGWKNLTCLCNILIT